MVRRAYRQRSPIEVPLPDAAKLWDPTLGRIDALLEDESLIELIAETLARRHPQRLRRGRLGTPATVVVRMLVLKHLYEWSFDVCDGSRLRSARSARASTSKATDAWRATRSTSSTRS
jgi:hypothetical protein